MSITNLQDRRDYSFSVKEAYLPELRTGRFENFTDFDAENGLFETAVAVLEVGYLDIELNLSAANGEDDSYINEIVPSYFVCAKGEPGPGSSDDWKWAEVGYLDDLGYETEVDWNAANWQELLEKDMLKKLCAFADKHGLSFDKPNWTGEENRGYWFNKLFGPSEATA